MYLRKLYYKEELSGKDHHSSKEDNRKYLLSLFLFTLIVVLSILLSSLSEAEIKFF
jgi:hypothetical protein